MSKVQLESKILGILKSSGLKREEIQEVLQNLNNQLQNSEADDNDFFLKLRKGIVEHSSESSSRWISSEEVDCYL
jgi:hypothetical protein